MYSRTRRILFTVFIVILAVSIVAASSSIKFRRVKFGQDADFAMGRAGISFTGSQYTGTVQLKRVAVTNSLAEETPSFLTSWLDLRLTKDNDERVTHVIGSVYVYFKVRRSEARKFANGELTIYLFDTWTKTWEECSTFAVRDKNQVTRLGCRMRVFGLYGLGYK